MDNFQLFRANFTRNQTKMLLFIFENNTILSYPDIQLLSPLKLQVAEVESRTQGSRPRPRTQKNSEAKAKDSLFEDRTSRGQGQERSKPRPRTKDTGASVLRKKVFKIFFQAISNSLAYPEFLIGGGLNHKSHAMTSSKFFERGSFCWTKIS